MKKALCIILLLILLSGCTKTSIATSSYATAFTTSQTTLDIEATSDTSSAVSSFSASSSSAQASNSTAESSINESLPDTTKPIQSEPTESNTLPDTEIAPSEPTDISEQTPKATHSETQEYIRPDSNEVAALTAMYINQLRDSEAVILPGLTGVANYRAEQLIYNFSHNDSANVCTILQYGEFVDMAEYGGSESDSYYQGYNREAIAKGNWTGSADEIAQAIATGFKNSSSHWQYVGDSKYGYMAVGVTYNPSESVWYVCVCMSSNNYGG